jgi:hypothetical protein
MPQLLLYTRVSISDKKDRGARPFVKVERRATKPIFYHWRAGGFETVAHSRGFSTRVVDVFAQRDQRVLVDGLDLRCRDIQNLGKGRGLRMDSPNQFRA